MNDDTSLFLSIEIISDKLEFKVWFNLGKEFISRVSAVDVVCYLCTVAIVNILSL